MKGNIRIKGPVWSLRIIFNHWSSDDLSYRYFPTADDIAFLLEKTFKTKRSPGWDIRLEDDTKYRITIKRSLYQCSVGWASFRKII